MASKGNDLFETTAATVEVNAIGRVIRELKRAEGRPQAHCPHLDLPLQRYVTERWRSINRASAVHRCAQW